MRTKTIPVVRLLLALLMVVAGLVCWTAAGIAEDLAERHQRMATLQEVNSTRSSRWRALVERLVEINSGESTLASTDYWAGRYDAVRATANDGTDPAILLLAANASYRKAQREAAGRTPPVERLDQAAQGYAGVLKNGGFHADAAYNYEFVARLRDSVAKSKGAAPERQTRLPAPRRNDDLPSGATIHGRPGTHPPNTKGEDFEVLTPMDYGDREAQPEATPGRPLPRKG